ncbi:MAG: Mannose-1-phosphate guanylyltransferase / phosphomannose isomerase [Candidatus Moranbacteria bacterium GW2011_GWC2_37_8]|nr:MAG: Mannose-1-phosphate guanylyltransferase / phosphomannose isomerase [Candidatus Moranbacteria bacterium GW2011_GWC2_37_8]KKQ63340.1 MAG: Mannose-1-phosphate guanylyltransferase / phosphomannose isomerase [Parcubacteria group bacterium GW2011_GWC1_38_22]KKQ79325.1 MAG: Mannose-1-phosphate guanylyltransferase / phosphomannose isomerase [Candidatus Moranbacteria bacterium GW2011_GWD2_38_7]
MYNKKARNLHFILNTKYDIRNTMYSIILCGGSGTRLWPLSRKNFSKQFLKLYSDKSMIQETFDRMSGVVAKENIYFVTGKDNVYNVFNQISEIYPGFQKQQIIIEPVARDTTPAIMLAVKYLHEKIGVDVNVPIIEVHSDHFIGKKEVYQELAKRALASLGNNIGLIGITPTKPDTRLGHIEKGEKENDHFRVASFKEKPDLETAKKFLATGKYVWNAGMYMFNIQTFINELEICDREMFELYKQEYEVFVANFEKMPKIAIDYVLAERSKKVIMFEGDFDWSDIGSFDELAEVAERGYAANTKRLEFDSKNVYTNSISGRLIVTVGVDDINVVENNDVILIQKKGKSAEMKNVVEYLKEHNYKEVEHNIEVQRPWGKYEVLIDEKNHKVKKITVLPGSTLSLQSHERRSEHWVVVKGIAQVVNGEDLLVLHENQSTYIPATSKHRLSNPGLVDLEIIEVQTGDYLEEDDIVRYEDTYGRK